MTFRFDSVAYNSDDRDGRRRFGTYWTDTLESGSLSVETRFLVSSVVDPRFDVCETMIFPVEEGEVNFSQVWQDDEFRGNASQHSVFLQEFLRAQMSPASMSRCESVDLFGFDLC